MVLVQFIIGAVWVFLLTSIVYAIMQGITKSERPTLWRESFDICTKTALLGVFPYIWVTQANNLIMSTKIYAAATFVVAVSLTAFRIKKPPKLRFEEELACERKSQAMMALCNEVVSYVRKPDANDILQAERCDLLRSMWASLTADQRKIALLFAEGNTIKSTAVELNFPQRVVEGNREIVLHKLSSHSSAELATIIAAIKACGIDVNF